jgi:hypothetical protein
MSGTLIPPDGGVIGSTGGRKITCRVLGSKSNRCSNEAVTNFGACAHHLAEFHREFMAILEAHGVGLGALFGASVVELS